MPTWDLIIINGDPNYDGLLVEHIGEVLHRLAIFIASIAI